VLFAPAFETDVDCLPSVFAESTRLQLVRHRYGALEDRLSNVSCDETQFYFLSIRDKDKPNLPVDQYWCAYDRLDASERQHADASPSVLAFLL
jgi:hypothetical protein